MQFLRANLVGILLAVGLVVNLIYVWTLELYVTQDGPSHLYNAIILQNLVDNPTSSFNLLFRINDTIFPNWLGSLIYLPLLKVFTPFIAEKVIISLIIIFFVLSSYWVVQRINSGNKFLSLFFLFLGQNFFLHFGFYNYLISLILFNVFIAVQLRNRKLLSIKKMFVRITLLVIIFFTHPVALILILFYYGVDILTLALQTRRWQPIMYAVPVVLPVLVLFGLYWFGQSSGSGGESVLLNNFSLSRLAKLGSLYYLNGFGTIEFMLNIVFGTLLLFWLVLFIIRKGWKNLPSESIAIIAVLLFSVFVYFFVSDAMAGGTFLSRRITLVVYMTVIYTIVFGNYRNLKWQPVTSAVVVFILSVVLLVYRYPIHRQVSRIALSVINTIEVAKPDGPFLILSDDDYNQINPCLRNLRIRFFKHIACYAAVSAGLITLDNYEANTMYFPILWKNGANPYEFIDDAIASDPWDFNGFQWREYERQSGIPLGFVVVLGKNRSDRFRNFYSDDEINIRLFSIHEDRDASVYRMKNVEGK